MMTATAGQTPDFDLTTPLRTDADVLSRVDALIDSPERGRRSLWLFFLSADGVQLPVVIPVDDVPPRPEPGQVGNFLAIVASIITAESPGGSAIVTLTRPENRVAAESDAAWLRALRSAARKHRAPIRMLCLATPAGVREFAAPEPAAPEPSAPVRF